MVATKPNVVKKSVQSAPAVRPTQVKQAQVKSAPARVEAAKPVAAKAAAKPAAKPVPIESSEHPVKGTKGTMTVFRPNMISPKDFSQEKIDVPEFVGPTAYVGYSEGFTIQMSDGAYKKVKIDVSLPCYPVQGEIDSTLEFAKSLVEERLTAEFNDVEREAEEDGVVAEEVYEESDGQGDEEVVYEEDDDSGEVYEEEEQEQVDGEEVDIQVGMAVRWVSGGKTLTGTVVSFSDDSDTIQVRRDDNKRTVSLRGGEFSLA